MPALLAARLTSVDGRKPAIVASRDGEAPQAPHATLIVHANFALNVKLTTVIRRRQTESARRRRGRRKSKGDRWLVLLVVVMLVIIAAGVIGPTSFKKLPPNIPEPLTMAQARASNAAVPIQDRRRHRATRFRFRGGEAAGAQAIECLATAALYEAGDDRRGQEAVIQVILNRMRAPGFPRTICGVVYQGASRRIGCQFSFTCDGSVQRRPIHTGWPAARRIARRALAGHVFGAVGRATHYHADWVVPYWRDSLAKIAKVGTHLFYVRA